MGDCISYLDLAGSFDSRDNIADIACSHLTRRDHLQTEFSYFIGFVLFACVKKLNLVPFSYHPVLNFEIGNDPAEGVEHRIKYKSL
ncbi:hypothetical protein SDC9_164218 [bioreactor metagenome]|uniref:Uncharacterized protein n=1 Tax=bioreactor metagenome TaxID=1076179 RepID=A0A645FR29_9ZZZZ